MEVLNLFRLLVSRDSNGVTPAHLAARGGHLHLLNFLVQLCNPVVRYGTVVHFSRILRFSLKYVFINFVEIKGSFIKPVAGFYQAFMEQ